MLKGDTAIYTPYESIKATLDYDFSNEKNFSYEGLTINESVQHIARFTSDIWQIHPFGEGNARSTAVFIIKYLKTFGFKIDNEPFAQNSWYFRNALVRANYNNLHNGIHSTIRFLEMFFENLLLDTDHELKSRYMHIDHNDQSANVISSKCQNGTLKLSLDELAIVKAILINPFATQTQIAEVTGISQRTIKRRTVEMQKKASLNVKTANVMASGKYLYLMQY
ncbi:MAG: Fic family protein [Erysipelotrichaceae bacterium]|nr:Fic family protein [Erysipelotrichaceae bacterium]